MCSKRVWPFGRFQDFILRGIDGHSGACKAVGTRFLCLRLLRAVATQLSVRRTRAVLLCANKYTREHVEWVPRVSVGMRYCFRSEHNRYIVVRADRRIDEVPGRRGRSWAARQQPKGRKFAAEKRARHRRAALHVYVHVLLYYRARTFIGVPRVILS